MLCYDNDVGGTLHDPAINLEDSFYSVEVHFENGNGQGDEDFCLCFSLIKLFTH